VDGTRPWRQRRGWRRTTGRVRALVGCIPAAAWRFVLAPNSLRRQAQLTVDSSCPPRLSLYGAGLAAAALFPAAAFGLTVLGFKWGLPPNISLSDADLVGLWTVAATVFALTAAVASLVITTSVEPLDRLRMIRRYRRNAFDVVALFGLSVTFWVGMIIAWMPLDAHGQSTGPVEWVLLLLALLLLGVGYLLYYAQRLISRSEDQKIRWLEDDMVEAFRDAVVSRVAVVKLDDLTTRVAGDHFVLQYDTATDQKPPSKTDRIFKLETSGYFHDVAMDHFEIWLQACTRIADLPLRGTYAGILGRHFRNDDAVALVRNVKSRIDAEAMPPDEPRRAFVLRRRDPAAHMQMTLKGLRDKACASAMGGQTAEFELQLEALTRLVVQSYRLSGDYQSLLPKGLSARTLAPRVALRAAMHELGEEVFRTRSPNIVGAWMHFPQRLLQDSRGHPLRTVPIIMYPWWRTAQVIQQLAGRDEESVSLLTDTIGVRLHYYVDDLKAAIDYAPPQPDEAQEPPPDDLNAQLKEEGRALRRVLARLFSAIDPTHQRAVQDVWDRIPVRDKDSDGHLWLRCGRHLLADYADGHIASNVSLEPRWDQVARGFKNLDDMCAAFQSLQKSNDEVAEQQVYQTYAQMINLTWEEQMEVGLGLSLSPIRDPARDLERVMLVLVLQLAEPDRLGNTSRGTADWLFDFVLSEGHQAVLEEEAHTADAALTAEFMSRIGLKVAADLVPDFARVIESIVAHKVVPEELMSRNLSGKVKVCDDAVTTLLTGHPHGAPWHVTGHEVLAELLAELLTRAQQELDSGASVPLRIQSSTVWTWLSQARPKPT
jgi:hypothetical protein